MKNVVTILALAGWLLWAGTALAESPSAMEDGSVSETWSEGAPDADEPAGEDATPGFWPNLWDKARERTLISGFAEFMQSFAIAPPNDTIISRARARLKLEADLDEVYAFASVDAQKNWKIPEEDSIAFHELWLEHIGDGWDLRVGRQIIIWGKADGVQITDLISPPDYTEYVTRDLDEIRMPVDAAKFRLLGEWVDTELIWIPVFKAVVYPADDNPWALATSYPQNFGVTQDSADKPATTLGNSEVALKVSAYLPGFDIAASVFHTWDDMAAMHRTFSGDEQTGYTLKFTPKHHRMTVFGLEFSRPWSDYVFRGEAAWYVGRYFATSRLDVDPLPKDALKWLVGVDWTPGNNWTVITQLTGQSIADYEEVLSAHEHDLTATLNISKKLLRETLTLSSMLYYHFNDLDFFYRCKAEYKVTDNLHVLVGLDYFDGEDGQFGPYNDNSQVWFKTKYSF